MSRKNPESFLQVFLADIRQAAFVAVGLGPGGADLPSVINQPVAEIAAFLRRNNFPECHLHPFRVFDPVHQADPVAQADTVSVGDNGGLAKYVPHNQVGAFPAYPGKSQQGIKVLRDPATILIGDNFHAGYNVPGFAPPQAAGADYLLHGILPGGCQSGRGGIFGKQVLHHHIHPGVGALGGQAHLHQQLPGVVIVQGAVGQRVFFFQPPDAFQGQF